MQESAVRELFESILSVPFIEAEATRIGVQKRQRMLSVAELVASMVLMGGSREAGRLSAALRDYFERGTPRVVRGASSKWFDEELLKLMESLSKRALDYATAIQEISPVPPIESLTKV